MASDPNVRGNLGGRRPAAKRRFPVPPQRLKATPTPRAASGRRNPPGLSRTPPGIAKKMGSGLPKATPQPSPAATMRGGSGTAAAAVPKSNTVTSPAAGRFRDRAGSAMSPGTPATGRFRPPKAGPISIATTPATAMAQVKSRRLPAPPSPRTRFKPPKVGIGTPRYR